MLAPEILAADEGGFNCVMVTTFDVLVQALLTITL
jgi:hypothetical protein